MTRARDLLSLWAPPVIWMAVLFFSSATPSSSLPSFGSMDYVIKKTGHAVGYATLALLFRRALGWDQPRVWAAWVLAVAYAMSDEFHQSFVPGRHPAWLDVFLFDGGGAALSLWLSSRSFWRRGT